MKITIPTPCHENWNEMTPNEMGRHCAVCSKTVKDFTDCSYEEIYNELNSNQNICGRFNDNQLNKDFYHEIINKIFSKFAIGFIVTTAGLVSVSGQQSSKSMENNPPKIIGENPSIEVKQNNLQSILQGRIGAVKTIQPFNEPLYIIDEKISANSDFTKLNSNHIKSIKVLKGEEATNLYGEKGSNGVILITTNNKQKGKKH